MPFVSSQGRLIYYERHGEGLPVLFLHGAGSNAATWWQQLPAFMAAGHTCITMDIRCFGRSVAPLEEFRFPLFVDDVLAVLDHEGVRRVAIVGQSLGGMIGLRLTLEHPERVAALIACDSTLGIDHAGLLDILAKRRVSVAAASIEQRSLGAWFLTQHPELAALYAQINHFNPSAHAIPAQQWGAALAGLMAPVSLRSTEALRQVDRPSLFLVGSEDPLVPVAVMQEVSGLVPHSEVAVVAQAGHSAYFEKAREVNAHVLAFIRRRAVFTEGRAAAASGPGIDGRRRSAT